MVDAVPGADPRDESNSGNGLLIAEIDEALASDCWALPRLWSLLVRA